MVNCFYWLLAASICSAKVPNFESYTFLYRDRVVSTDADPVLWRSDWPTDMRAEFVSYNSLSLHFFCKFFKRDIKTVVSSSLCFKYKKSGALGTHCVTMGRRDRSKTFTFGPAEVSVSYDPQLGLKASLLDVPPEKELPLVAVTCRVDTMMQGIFQSNQLFVLDFRNQFPKDVWQPSKAPVLKQSKQSFVKCLQKNVTKYMDTKLGSWGKGTDHAVIPLNVEWFFCSESSLEACKTSKVSVFDVVNPAENATVSFLQTGDFWSARIPTEAKSLFEKKHLLCYLFGKPHAFYTSPIKVVGPDTRVEPASMYRPEEEQDVLVYSSKYYSLNLPCAVHREPLLTRSSSSGEIFLMKWTFGNPMRKVHFSKILSNGETYRDFGISISKRGEAATLFGPFKSDNHGCYLECQYQIFDKKGKKTLELRGKYIFRIKASPQLAPTFSHLLDMPYCGHAELNCAYYDSTITIPSIAVMGTDIDLSSVAAVNASKKRINDKIKGKRPPLKFYVSAVNPQQSTQLLYYEWNQIDKPSYHYVTCAGRNPPYRTRWRIKFRSSYHIQASPQRRCNFYCQLYCNADSRFTSNGKTSILVEWYAQGDDKCDTKGTYLASGNTLYYNATQAVGGFIKCTISYSNPQCGERFAQTCRVSKISYTPPFKFPLWAILLTTLGVGLFLMACNCIRYFVFVKHCLKMSQGTRV